MARQPEGKLVRKLSDYLQQEGCVTFKIHGGDNPFQAVGIPDLLVGYDGYLIGIEAKLPGQKLRPMQVVALREIYNAHACAAVVETVEQGEKLLSEFHDWRLDGEGYNNSCGMLFDRSKWRRRFTLS